MDKSIKTLDSSLSLRNL